MRPAWTTQPRRPPEPLRIPPRSCASLTPNETVWAHFGPGVHESTVVFIERWIVARKVVLWLRSTDGTYSWTRTVREDEPLTTIARPA